MYRFALRHWTALLVAALCLSWALFYLPSTPSFAVLELKRAIDARDAETAARFVDFPSLVRHAGYELLESKEGGADVVSRLIGRGAVDLLYRPLAEVTESWAKREVAEGAEEVQMPAAAVVAAIATLYRDGSTAYTRFRDRKARVWEIRLGRDAQGRWQIVEVKNIRQLLDKLQHEKAKEFGGR